MAAGWRPRGRSLVGHRSGDQREMMKEMVDGDGKDLRQPCVEAMVCRGLDHGMVPEKGGVRGGR